VFHSAQRARRKGAEHSAKKPLGSEGRDAVGALQRVGIENLRPQEAQSQFGDLDKWLSIYIYTCILYKCRAGEKPL
jgi:hypothetical protein